LRETAREPKGNLRRSEEKRGVHKGKGTPRGGEIGTEKALELRVQEPGVDSLKRKVLLFGKATNYGGTREEKKRKKGA